VVARQPAIVPSNESHVQEQILPRAGNWDATSPCKWEQRSLAPVERNHFRSPRPIQRWFGIWLGAECAGDSTWSVAHADGHLRLRHQGAPGPLPECNGGAGEILDHSQILVGRIDYIG
jgi:hypothetical protein